MKQLKKLTLIAAMLGIGLSGAAQGEAIFSYSDATAQRGAWGTAKNEVYNVAIYVNDASMVGKKIVGMRVTAPYSTNVSDIKAFLTKNLAKGKPEGSTVTQNMPDIEEVVATDNHGSYTARFTPYTLTEEGVYVGYTLTAKINNEEPDAVSRAPIAVTQGSVPGSFWIYCSRTYMQWGDKSSQLNVKSAIEVIFEGDFDTESCSCIIDNTVVRMAADELEVPVTLINHGSNPISSLDYTMSFDDQIYKGHKDFPTPLELTYGGTYETTLDYKLPLTVGQKTVTLTIDKINGVDNANPNKTTTTTFGILEFVPTKRVVMEEYTGLGCGYCPRGFGAMEYLNRNYGIKTENPTFISIAYHNYTADPMMHIEASKLPGSPSGYPSCNLDRTTGFIDPYYGTGAPFMGIEDDFKNLQKEFTPVDVTCKAIRENGNKVKVTATVRLSRAIEGTPRLAYLIVGDHMSDPTWLQSNYLAGQSAANFPIPEMEKFINGPKQVANLEFDDVALAASNLRGETSTLTGNLPLNTDLEYDYTFDLNNCYSLTTGQNLALKQYAKDFGLRAIVMCVDTKTGKILNANTCWLDGKNDTPFNIEEATVSGYEYYDLSGRMVTNPETGLYVRVATYSDGKRVSEKVMVK